MSSAVENGPEAPAPGREIGSLISAVFGCVFVGANVGGMTSAVHVTLLILAGLALLAVLVLIVRSLRVSDFRTDHRRKTRTHSPGRIGPSWSSRWWPCSAELA
ncbi:MAG: hypothetical protein QM589_00635 [Thermomicrobiales bacterium]